jgi:hypothetical protein
MTAITFVGTTAGVSGDDASLSPTIHASAAAGDLILIFAGIRNTAAVPHAPAGYREFFIDHGCALFYKIHSGTEATPTVTFTGGATGDTTMAKAAVFRTVMPHVQVVFGGTVNVSAQDIALPAAQTPGRAGALLLALGFKQDDWTSVSILSGMSGVGNFFSTTGNDAGMVWDYQIQTTPAAGPAGPFTVTGGASAASNAYTIALDQAAAIAVTPQDVYPPRVLVSVTSLVVGDGVELYRVVGGQRTLVRAGADASVSDTSFLRADAELPFGVPVSYLAVINGFDGPITSATTYTLPGGKVALSDAISGLSAEVVITAWPDKARTRQSSVFQPGGRNVAVLGDLVPPTGTIDVYVETTSALDNLDALLDSATQGVIQIRQPGGYDGVDSYIAVLSATEHRWSQDGSDQRRTVSLDSVEVDSWAAALEARAFTLQDIDDAYSGADATLTLTDLSNDFATLLDIALADWGA